MTLLIFHVFFHIQSQETSDIFKILLTIKNASKVANTEKTVFSFQLQAQNKVNVTENGKLIVEHIFYIYIH